MCAIGKYQLAYKLSRKEFCEYILTKRARNFFFIFDKYSSSSPEKLIQKSKTFSSLVRYDKRGRWVDISYGKQRTFRVRRWKTRFYILENVSFLFYIINFMYVVGLFIKSIYSK